MGTMLVGVPSAQASSPGHVHVTEQRDPCGNGGSPECRRYKREHGGKRPCDVRHNCASDKASHKKDD